MDIKAKQVLSYVDPLSTSTSGRLPTRIVTTEAKYFGCSTLAILWCIERLRIKGPYNGKDGLAATPHAGFSLFLIERLRLRGQTLA
jgi:hypothetical protein